MSLVAGGLLWLGSQPARAIDANLFGTGASCAAGNCTHGEGTIRTANGTEFTGQWSQGRFLEGRTYRVRSPLEPERLTDMQYDSSGYPVRGTLLRGEPSVSKKPVGEYTGTFSAVANPFVPNGMLSTYQSGKYTDRKTGLVYEGEFSYVPLRANGLVSGTMIFQGVRIDEEADEVVRGLFVSEPLYSGQPILFRKARPDYLVKLQQDFEMAQASAVADAHSAEDRQRSGEGFASLIGVMGGLMALSGGGGGSKGLSALQGNSLAGLTSALSGRQSSGDILKGVLAQVAQEASADPTLARALGGTTKPADLLGSLSGLGKASQTMTRAAYAAQLVASAAGREPALPTPAVGREPLASPAAPRAAGPGPSGSAEATGTVALHYTPGKGLLDPVTGRFVRSPEELSCDNLTTRGQRLGDLPIAARGCRVQ